MFQRYIDSQYRKPTGIVGRWIGSKMAQQHRPETLWTLKLLDIQSSDRILEVGFGPGMAIEAASRTAALVAGVDISRTMVRAASRRCAAAIRAGRIDLRYADAASLPFGARLFNTVFSIHSIYFWHNPLTALKEIHRVLLPGGKIVLTVLPRERWNETTRPALACTPDCHPYSGDELKHLLRQAGFDGLHIEADSRREFRSNYSVIGCKER